MEYFKPTLADTTKQMYLSKLKKINDGDFENLDFLKDWKKVWSKISQLTTNLNTQKSFLIVVSSVLADKPEYDEVHKQYKKVLMEYNVLQKEQKNVSSDNQKEEWISKEELMGIYEKLKSELTFAKRKIWSSEDFVKFRDFLILSLYLLQEPRRNKDYFFMKVGKKADDKSNWLLMKELQFVFNDYKTASKYGKQTIDIGEELYKILKVYLAHHPLKKEKSFNLLVNTDGTPLKNSNFITLTLNRLLGRKIGVSMLRNMFLTDKFKGGVIEQQKLMEDIKDTAEKMGTSLNVALNTYIKTDVN
jgi:hypothetical protein